LKFDGGEIETRCNIPISSTVMTIGVTWHVDLFNLKVKISGTPMRDLIEPSL